MPLQIGPDRERTRRLPRHCLALVGGILLTFSMLSAGAQSLPETAKRALFNGDWTAVLATLEKPDVKEPDVTSRMVAAHAYLATNRNNEALVVFLSVTEPEQLGQWRAWTGAAAKSESQSAIPHYLYGDALARAGELAAAEHEFSQALERNLKMGLALVGRGTVRALQGKYDPAYMDLHVATQVQPDLADAHASLGSLEVILQNAEGALAAFNEALRLDPTFALAYNGRGCARYGLGKPDEAATDFEMAMTLLPALLVGEANHGFLLALVARKVDERMRSAETPGTTLTTRSQAMVIDVPGIWTQGEDRPGKWAPVLLGTSTYERFNIRHEGIEALMAEPGQTIVIPRNATAEIRQRRLQPVFDAQRQGKDVYVKVDQDVGLGAYMTEGWRAEQRWAAGVTNVIAQNTRQSYPAMPIYLNTHSHGTDVVFEVDLTLLTGVIFASPRSGRFVPVGAPKQAGEVRGAHRRHGFAAWDRLRVSEDVGSQRHCHQLQVRRTQPA